MRTSLRVWGGVLALWWWGGHAEAVSLSTNRPVVKHMLARGEAVQGSIEVENHDARPLSVKVYLEDWRYTVTLALDSLPLRYLPVVSVRRQIELMEGGTVTLDMPVTVRRVIEGRVYLDENDNGQLDASEAALKGMPICVDGRRVVTTDVRGTFRAPETSVGFHQLALNCGMPLQELLPLSNDQPTIAIGPDDPETLTVDFRLIRKVPPPAFGPEGRQIPNDHTSSPSASRQVGG